MKKNQTKQKKPKEIVRIAIDLIDLDVKNPRFGNGSFDSSTSQPEILNFIVKNFGVDDVLSSLAVNGFFAAEPLVCRKNGDRYVVLEGNRRLAAMLILSNDDRAASHKERIRKYRELHEQHGFPPIDPVPAIVFEKNEDDKNLLSYLGVRHIVSIKDWDSFAKAHWIYSTVNSNQLSVADVSTMTGDNHQAIKKLLQGYNYVAQLEEKNLFNPDNSNKAGRGSNTKYPFSWVYTILGYKQIKDFLKLSEDPIDKNPIPKEALEDAALLLRAMFGDRSKGKDSQVGDSRNLALLADAVSTPEKIRLLRNGENVTRIGDLTRPADERLSDIFFSIQKLLDEANNRLVTEVINSEKIPALQADLLKVRKQLKVINDLLYQQNVGVEEL